MFSSHPPKHVQFGWSIRAFIVVSATLRTPTPNGLETNTSAAPSLLYSAAGPNWLSAVLSSYPPNRVRFGAVKAVIVPLCSVRCHYPAGLR